MVASPPFCAEISHMPQFGGRVKLPDMESDPAAPVAIEYTLVPFPNGGSRLLNRATGEIVDTTHLGWRRMEAVGDEIHLVDGSGGDEEGEVPPVNVAGLFRKRLEVQRGAMMMVEDGQSTAISELEKESTTFAMRFYVAGAETPFTTEVYHFACSRGGSCVFWVLRFFTGFLQSDRRN